MVSIAPFGHAMRRPEAGDAHPAVSPGYVSISRTMVPVLSTKSCVLKVPRLKNWISAAPLREVRIRT